MNGQRKIKWKYDRKLSFLETESPDPEAQQQSWGYIYLQLMNILISSLVFSVLLFCLSFRLISDEFMELTNQKA